MERITHPDAMATWAADAHRRGLRIGFVPTMGFLHRGHASLMDLARPRCDVLVVSVYVNPLQFGPNEDLDRYPRDLEGDATLCAAHGVDLLFAPANLYPKGFATSVAVHGLTERLCGASRPGHFDGVATVCTRLFGLTRADVAVFGDKDFQQLAVIRALVRDLAVPVEIVGGPLVRDDDGVALSSRNAYLSPDLRARARTLHRALFALRDAASGSSSGGPTQAGERDAEVLLARARALLDCDRLDYLELVDPDTLQPLAHLDRPGRALVAAYYGATRLIDNVGVEVG